MIQVIHVVVAVITDAQGRVLITLRPNHVHQGGLWEFPGGKVEPEETVFKALKREIYEEVGLVIHRAEPLIKLIHRYRDKQVFLDVWSVSEYGGRAFGNECQEWQWVAKSDLDKYEFPEANRFIIRAAQLPDCYLITPEPGKDKSLFLRQLESALSNDIRMLQFRAKSLSHADYRAMAADVLAICRQSDATLLLNAEPSVLDTVDADGLQLTSEALMQLSTRPVPNDIWVGASCHNEFEIQHAESIDADFVVLAPVLATSTHPNAKPLGWQSFESLVSDTRLPVFALGGMNKKYVSKVRQLGGRGIAAIRGLWQECGS